MSLVASSSAPISAATVSTVRAVAIRELGARNFKRFGKTHADDEMQVKAAANFEYCHGRKKQQDYSEEDFPHANHPNRSPLCLA